MTRTYGTQMTVDTTGLRKFARSLRYVSPEAARVLRSTMKDAGKLVADDATKRAEAFSKSIPPTIKVRTSGINVTVQAGGISPLAMLNEKRDGWRHPVFGNRSVWVDQPSHHFLAPALQAKRSEVAELLSHELSAMIDRLLTGEYGGS